MVIHCLNLQFILFFGQQHQLQLFVRTGCSNVVTVGNVSIRWFDVMGGAIAMMVVMNGIVVCIAIICYDEKNIDLHVEISKLT